MSQASNFPRWKGTLHVVAPSAPPKICGVGDHSFHLSAALARRGKVLVHCGQISPEPRFEGCDMVVDFDHRFPWTLKRVATSPTFQAGDSVFFQYTNFAYGRYGFNPWIAPALARLRRRGVRVVTMFHETYMPAVGVKIRLMGWWQRQFFRSVGRNSDVCLFSTAPWVEQYSSWFPGKTVDCLPIGSNIRPIPVDRAAEREHLGIGPNVPCLVIFGGIHPSRLFDWMVAATQELNRRGVAYKLLHVGPDVQGVAELFPHAPLVELGIQSEAGVSKALSAGDLLLAPISDGASTRRGSLLAGLEHGLCCITTRGATTDELLGSQGGKSLRFASDKADFVDGVCAQALDREGSRAMGANAAAFYRENFSWEFVADRLTGFLDRN